MNVQIVDRDGVQVVTLDNPPVNAISFALLGRAAAGAGGG